MLQLCYHEKYEDFYILLTIYDIHELRILCFLRNLDAKKKSILMDIRNNTIGSMKGLKCPLLLQAFSIVFILTPDISIFKNDVNKYLCIYIFDKSFSSMK